MPPRRPASANGTGGDDNASAMSTPKRVMRSSRTRQMNTSSGSTGLSQFELSTEVGTRATTQAGGDEERILDEIIVSGTPKNTRAKDTDVSSEAIVVGGSADTSRPLRRSRRASSISQGGSAVLSPSGTGVSIKKQDFLVGIAADDDDGEPDELSDPRTVKKQKVEPKTTKRVALRKRSKWDNPDEMLTDPNSPLAKANLRELLCSPRAWEILTQEEKEKILAEFPDDAEILDPGTPNARPNIAALRNNDNFRHDVARYQEGLSKGFHDPEWIQQAQSAHRSREMGLYDEFMANDFEKRWDMPMPQQPRAESKINGNGSSQAARSPDGAVNDMHVELKTEAPSAEATDEGQGGNGTAEFQPTSIQHDKLAEINVQDQDNHSEDATGSRLEHVTDISAAENSKEAQSLGSDDKQAGSSQVDAVTTPNSTDQGDQKTKDCNHDVGVSSVPSMPAVPEETEQQHKEKPSEINVAQQTDAMEAAGAQAVLTQIIERLTSGPQEQQNGIAPSESKVAEEKDGDKQET